jgi:hypothetical protein
MWLGGETRMGRGNKHEEGKNKLKKYPVQARESYEVSLAVSSLQLASKAGRRYLRFL